MTVKRMREVDGLGSKKRNFEEGGLSANRKRDERCIYSFIIFGIKNKIKARVCTFFNLYVCDIPCKNDFLFVWFFCLVWGGVFCGFFCCC